MDFLIVLLGLLLLAILLKYIALKQQIRKIAKQIKKLSEGETEKILDISLVDKDVEMLAGQFNRYYEKRKTEVSKSLYHEGHLKEMIANITHDLRTPLTVIDGHLQMLKKTELSEDQKRRVTAVLGKTYRMKELTETLYDLALLDADKMPITMERVNFSNLLMDFLSENAVLFEKNEIEPVVHLPQESVFVNADRNMLERILQNLLSNALRYTSGKIEIALLPISTGMTTLEISNPVRNISEIDTERLFDRFYMGDKPRTNGGSGLGLAVVKSLAEKMQGNISATKNGNELSFILELKQK